MDIFPACLVAIPQVPHSHLLCWLPGAIYSSREGLVYLHPYVLSHVEGLAGKIACGTISCPQVKPNLSPWSPVGIFWIGCLPKRELCCCIVASKKQVFSVSFRISRSGARRVKEVMAIGRKMPKCAFHRRHRRIQLACLLVTLTSEEECFCDCFYYRHIKSISFGQPLC